MSRGVSISEQLRRRRRALGLSLAQVASRAGTSAATLARYEHGWTRFETYTLRKLATALRCELRVELRPATTRVPQRRATVADTQRLKRLFWDAPFDTTSWARHPVWVVERVVELGTLEDVWALQRIMGRRLFLESVAQSTRLSPKTREFWRCILEKEGIRCTRKYSRDTAWNS